MKQTDITEIDEKIWRKELEVFVPDKIFDFHTHLWNEKFIGENQDTESGLRLEIDLPALRAWSASIFPGRAFGFLTLPTPLLDIDVSSHNTWMIEQNRRYNLPAGDFPSATAILATPDMSTDELLTLAEAREVVALKPYRVYAEDPGNADIIDYFPESQMEAADSLGLAVVLHLSKFEGPADPQNLKDLTEFARKYPNITWILAHCARAFNPVFLEESIHVLKDLPSLWVDTSAVNDCYTHYLLFKHFNRKRILFGTDNVCAGGARGKYITYAYAWEGYHGQEYLEHCDPRTTLVVYEQLRSQKQAAEMAGLTETEIDDLFYGNALSLLSYMRE
jgi:hypothetical protein